MRALPSSTVRPVSPFAETALFVERELKKNFKSAKGVLLLVLCLLGGIGFTLAFVWIGKSIREEMQNAVQNSPLELMTSDGQDLELARKFYLSQFWGEENAKHLAKAPLILVIAYSITLRLSPLVTLLVSFDAIAGDLQYKVVRYFTVRARRTSYFVSKFLGLWLTVSLMTALLHFAIWMVGTLRGEAPFADLLSWGIRFWIFTLPMSAVWCAVATFVGSFFRHPALSLLCTLAAFFAIWFTAGVGGRLIRAVQFVDPNRWDLWLVSPDAGRTVAAFAACTAYAAAFTAAGSWLFKRSDV